MAETKSHIGTQNKKGQTYTDPWKMLNEAPRKPSFYTGSEVIKEAIRRASCDVMIAYPITPQSEAAALIGELFAEGYIGDYFRGESEFAVMSQCAGAAFGGARVFTTTAGPGTMRAMENFPMWAGARLPIQMIVTCRGINSPLSIQPDTLEIAYLLNTGMLVWHAETAQDFFDWILKGYMVSEEPDVHLPLALCCDGFFVTHTKDVVNLTPTDMCLPLRSLPFSSTLHGHGMPAGSYDAGPVCHEKQLHQLCDPCQLAAGSLGCRRTVEKAHHSLAGWLDRHRKCRRRGHDRCIRHCRVTRTRSHPPFGG